MARTLPEHAGRATMGGIIVGASLVSASAVIGAGQQAASRGVLLLLATFAFGAGFHVVSELDLVLFGEEIPTTAAARKAPGAGLMELLRRWLVSLSCNLVGGAAVALLISQVPALTGSNVIEPPLLPDVPVTPTAIGAQAIAGGVLIALLGETRLNRRVSLWTRLVISLFAGLLIVAGPFLHVVVELEQLAIGMSLTRRWDPVALGEVLAVGTLGNLCGAVAVSVLVIAGSERTGDHGTSCETT